MRAARLWEGGMNNAMKRGRGRARALNNRVREARRGRRDCSDHEAFVKVVQLVLGRTQSRNDPHALVPPYPMSPKHMGIQRCMRGGKRRPCVCAWCERKYQQHQVIELGFPGRSYGFLGSPGVSWARLDSPGHTWVFMGSAGFAFQFGQKQFSRNY